MKHLPLRLGEEHFERWLFLWQANCRAQLPSDVAMEMIDLAYHIADKLRMILGVSNFGQKSVQHGKSLIMNPTGTEP